MTRTLLALVALAVAAPSAQAQAPPGGSELPNYQEVVVGGTVRATLSLSLTAPARFGEMTPGVAATYTASTTSNVISTAGDALLTVSDPSSNHTGQLVNGPYFLLSPLQARARNATTTSPAYNNVSASLNLLSYSAPVTNDAVTIDFRQTIGESETLRSGSYGKTLTFTLSTTNP